ncbi:MAG: hypothetical protein GXY49_01900 [Syntrophomonadaceae bacterium]|nr:hypothetical protein [Syntrophomonadaceae bacterium]
MSLPHHCYVFYFPKEVITIDKDKTTEVLQLEKSHLPVGNDCSICQKQRCRKGRDCFYPFAQAD